MLPQVIQVQVSQVEGLAADVAAELFVLGVALLVGPERAAAAEALQAGLTAEGFGAGGPAAAPGAGLGLLSVLVDELLVFLELTVVEEGFPAVVAHEALLFSVNQHVRLQRPGARETLAAFITSGKTDFSLKCIALCDVDEQKHRQ